MSREFQGLVVRAEYRDPRSDEWRTIHVEDLHDGQDPADRVAYWSQHKALIAGGYEVRDVRAEQRQVVYTRL